MTVLSAGYHYDWGTIPGSLGILFKGLGYSVLLSIMAAALALVAGVIVALVHAAPVAPVRWLGFAYTQVFRAMSPYIYILWIYFGIAIAARINLDPFEAGVASLAFLYSAYMSEVYRSSFAALDPGQKEAALSLGLGRAGTFFKITFPQAFRIALPSLINLSVILFKDSSLVAAIGAPDLMYETMQRVTALNHPFEFYTVAAVLYIAVTYIFIQLAGFLERRLRRHIAN
jgi:His/Glu/Gln/Arg/opine family amino acid ABC transporter permease subunit